EFVIEVDIEPISYLYYISSMSAHRGAPSGGGPEGGAGSGVPRLRLVTAGSGGSETVRRALRPVLPGAGCTCSAGNGGAGNADPRPKIAKVERREASVPIARDAGASQAPGTPASQRARRGGLASTPPSPRAPPPPPC